jgi:uncharacterized membrane protein YfhO
VVTNTWHPQWKASVDGKPQRVLRANHCFQAVSVPDPGEHEVVLEFVDPLIGPLHFSVLLGLVVLGILVRIRPAAPVQSAS